MTSNNENNNSFYLSPPPYRPPIQPWEVLDTLRHFNDELSNFLQNMPSETRGVTCHQVLRNARALLGDIDALRSRLTLAMLPTQPQPISNLDDVVGPLLGWGHDPSSTRARNPQVISEWSYNPVRYTLAGGATLTPTPAPSAPRSSYEELVLQSMGQFAQTMMSGTMSEPSSPARAERCEDLNASVPNGTSQTPVSVVAPTPLPRRAAVDDLTQLDAAPPLEFANNGNSLWIGGRSPRIIPGNQSNQNNFHH